MTSETDNLVLEPLRRIRASQERIELDVMAELAHHGWKPDYIAVRRQSDLQPPQNGERGLVVLAAARLGKTRLIDNIETNG